MKLRTSRRSRNVVLEIEPKDAGLPPVSVAELRLKQILVAVDFSECSRKALHYAVSFARQFNAEITLLHVVQLVPPAVTVIPPGVTMTETTQMEATRREMAARQLAEWRREAGAASTLKAVTRDGTSISAEVVSAAEEANIDLIIIGNHGRTGVARAFLGSTAEHIVRHAPCPVLVVRQHEHDFLAEQRSASRTELEQSQRAS